MPPLRRAEDAAMVELLETDSEAGQEERNSSDDGPRTAHIAPVMADGKRHALCGAEILGVHVGNADYVLCEKCKRLRRFDYHDPSWDGKF